jgi:hypothetical protein
MTVSTIVEEYWETSHGSVRYAGGRAELNRARKLEKKGLVKIKFKGQGCSDVSEYNYSSKMWCAWEVTTL